MKHHSQLYSLAIVMWLATGALGDQKGDDVVHNPDDKGIPTPKETISFEQVDKIMSHSALAVFPEDWIISPISQTVIRKGEDAKTANYREADYYTFLINSMKRPRLCRLDNGRLILFATAWLEKIGTENDIMMISDDEGQSWTAPRRMGGGTPIGLGGDRVALLSDRGVSNSEDGGRTWSKEIKYPPLADSTPIWARHGTPFVEKSDGHTVLWSIFAVLVKPHGPTDWECDSVIRRSFDGGRTWSVVDDIRLPTEWCTSEGSVIRAADGALIVVLRSAQEEGWPSYSDAWRRITTARSTDNGKTWTDYQVHFRYGKVHIELLNLPNGDIVMSYAVRGGELDDKVYFGVEAVVSRDHGRTWDWANRYYLFRWAMHPTSHSVTSVLLGDNRILTMFLYHYDAPWGGRIQPEAMNTGLVNAMFWKPFDSR